MTLSHYEREQERIREARTFREQEEKRVRQALPGLARAVAAELGDGWREGSDDDDWRTRIFKGDPVDPTELVFFYVNHSQPGKVSICGGMPREVVEARVDYKNVPEIGVTLNRGAKVIAREILRRLLPAYRETLEAALIRAKKSRADTDTRDTVIKSIATLLGVQEPAPVRNHTESRSIWHGSYGDSRSLRIEVRRGGRIHMEVDGNFDRLADAIAALK